MIHNKTSHIPEYCDDTAMWQVWLSAFHAPTLAIADELGLFQHLSQRPSSAAELATAMELEVKAVEAMTALMASLQFLTAVDGRFHLTTVARQCLVRESPYYWGGFLKRIRETPLDCTKLIETLRAGAAGSGRVSAVWEQKTPPPEVLKKFTHAMHAHSFALAMRVVPSFPLAGARRLLDVAGGSGSFSIAATTHWPELTCTVLDLPAVCEVATDYIARAALDNRVTTVAANMFTQPWPAGADWVFMNDILHDWDDERCALLVRKAYESLGKGGTIGIHEMVLSDGRDGPVMAAAFSMAMVLTTRGKQRTARELTEMLGAAGFVDCKATPTSGGYLLIQGKIP